MPQNRPIASSHLAVRGVYMPPCLDESGHRYLVAIDSRHRVIHRARVFASDDVSEVTRMVRALLDEKDPPGS